MTMHGELFARRRAAGLILAVGLLAPGWTATAADVSVGGAMLSSRGLVAMGQMPANQRDKLGETFGSSSGMALVPQSWRRTATGYEGTLMLLPDRGYNVAGTTDYKPRLNTVTVTMIPEADGKPGQLTMKLTDSLVLTDAAGKPLSGLDPEGVRRPAAASPTCRRPRPAPSRSTPRRWCCCPTAAFSSATSTARTSTASRQPARCCRRSVRRKP